MLDVELDIDIPILTVQAIVDLITALWCLLRRCRTNMPNQMLEMSELKCYAYIAQISHIPHIKRIAKGRGKILRLNTHCTHSHITKSPLITHIAHCKHYTLTGERKKSEHQNRCWHDQGAETGPPNKNAH